MNRDSLLPNNKSLSIQLSSDGFSFCVYNSLSEQYEDLVQLSFTEKLLNPDKLLEKVKEIFETKELLHQNYSEINLIHHNDLNTFVPIAHFDEALLSDYLKHTVKTFDNDFISYDELNNIGVNNIYIPFVNINNYIFDSFGEFTYLHSSSIFLQNVLKKFDVKKKTIFLNVYNQDYHLFVIENNQLVLFNHFSFVTKEDFVYYILFVAEQLKMNPNEFELHLFGNVHKEDENYKLLYNYVRNVAIYASNNNNLSKNINSLPQENYNLLHFYL